MASPRARTRVAHAHPSCNYPRSMEDRNSPSVSFGQAIHDAFVSTFKYFEPRSRRNDSYRAIPQRGRGNGSPRCFDPFGHFIEQI
jgi:hypothetical protein